MLPNNREIAEKLRENATSLAHSGGSLYQVRAYRQAAQVILALNEEVSSIVAKSGQRALEQFPGIGKSLARTIVGYVLTSEREKKTVST
jgi:DNA polymerase/3'-5' exonuclease PolX